MLLLAILVALGIVAVTGMLPGRLGKRRLLLGLAFVAAAIGLVLSRTVQ